MAIPDEIPFLLRIAQIGGRGGGLSKLILQLFLTDNPTKKKIMHINITMSFGANITIKDILSDIRNDL